VNRSRHVVAAVAVEEEEEEEEEEEQRTNHLTQKLLPLCQHNRIIGVVFPACCASPLPTCKVQFFFVSPLLFGN
jgi:CO dehydrogenase/acetyl-CoA synthase beta subunit